jgi:uncharacterized protein YbjT (DUF2867 family)
MILIVGASGRMGSAATRQLLAAGERVRAMSRAPDKLAQLQALGAEVVAGDLRDAGSLARACAGVDRVLAAAHAFDGKGSNVPPAVDGAGNRHLIDAARAAGVGHFVLTSIHGAHAGHPIDLFRYKYAAEQYLRASGLSYTILRPTAFMDLWVTLIGTPIARQGKAMIFGRGTNPINFVSADDVARVAVSALTDPHLRGRTIEIGGPENFSLLQIIALIEQVTGRAASKQRIPLPLMRVMSVLMRPVNPALSRQIASGVVMDTQDMSFDPAEMLTLLPMRLTRMEEVVRSQYGSAAAG